MAQDSDFDLFINNQRLSEFYKSEEGNNSLKFLSSLRCRKFFCVLNLTDEQFSQSNVLETIRDTLLNFGAKVIALILHDKDLDEQGNLKTKHIHLYVRFGQRVYGSQLYYNLCFAFTTPFSTKQFSCECAYSERSSIRYLIHCDNNNKYQYEVSAICTNLYDISSYFAYDIDGEIDAESLVSLCEDYQNVGAVTKIIGLKNARKYAYLINVLCADARTRINKGDI